MSACWPGRMRGPRMKTPLLLLLLLLTSLTHSVFCQEEEEETIDEEVETPDEDAEADAEADADPGGDGDTTTPVIDASPLPDSVPETTGSDLGTEGEGIPGSGDEETTSPGSMYPGDVTDGPEEDAELSLIIILVPVVLVILFIAMIVCGIFVNRRWKQKARTQELVKDDPYLDGPSTEKVPMPMFEEDVPSVLELEMEELDQWMKKDSLTADDCNHA